MEIVIAAVGRQRSGAAKALYDSYAARLRWRVTLKEVEARRGLSGPALKRAEADRLAGAIPAGSALIALDEGGRDMTSPALAETLARFNEEGRRPVCFAIGGADGLDSQITGRADLVLAFGRATWPHMMVRAMLAEQIYRCQQIIAGHPYHRG